MFSILGRSWLWWCRLDGTNNGNTIVKNILPEKASLCLFYQQQLDTNCQHSIRKTKLLSRICGRKRIGLGKVGGGEGGMKGDGVEVVYILSYKSQYRVDYIGIESLYFPQQTANTIKGDNTGLITIKCILLSIQVRGIPFLHFSSPLLR